MAKDLRKVIEGLDPDNDAHWTGAGLPSVDAVSEANGGERVTRSDIADAYSGYDRDKARSARDGSEGSKADVDGDQDAPTAPTAEDEAASTERDGKVGQTEMGLQRDVDPQVAEEQAAARAPDGIEKDLAEADEAGPDAIQMINDALAAAQGPRYLRNSELQNFVRQWQIMQPNVVAWQDRLDRRMADRARNRDAPAG